MPRPASMSAGFAAPRGFFRSHNGHEISQTARPPGLGSAVTVDEIKSEMIDAREEYIEIIRDELLGPGSEFSVPDKEHEIISASPISRYSVGILFPQGNLVQQDNDETVPVEESEKDETDLEIEISEEKPSDQSDPTTENTPRSYFADETADENLDDEIGMSTQYMPSSMGITFVVRGDCTVVRG